jgi:hypothetical protein
MWKIFSRPFLRALVEQKKNSLWKQEKETQTSGNLAVIVTVAHSKS